MISPSITTESLSYDETGVLHVEDAGLVVAQALGRDGRAEQVPDGVCARVEVDLRPLVLDLCLEDRRRGAARREVRLPVEVARSRRHLVERVPVLVVAGVVVAGDARAPLLVGMGRV